MLGWRQFSKPMNDLQTMQFTVVMSFVSICIILGLIITELWRKLARERELSERLRLMASKNYHHRKTMERLMGTACHYIDMEIGVTPRLRAQMTEACKASKDDRD